MKKRNFTILKYNKQRIESKTMDNVQPKHLYEAILQVIYTTTKSPIQSWIKGSCFVIAYKEKLFILTASHCIEENDLEHLFLSKMSTKRNLFSIPIEKQVKVYDVRQTKVDSDLRILKIDDEMFKKNILDNTQIKSSEEYSNDIFQAPFVQRMKRVYARNPKKFIRKILSSVLYKTLIRKQNEEINNAIKNANTSLAEIKNLKLANKDFIYKVGTECQIYGYSTAKGQIEYDENGNFQSANQVLLQVCGELTGEYNDNTQTHAIKYDTNDDLDGISGGPVIAKGKVIGVASFIEKKEKKLYFIPVKFIYSSLDYYLATSLPK